MKDDQEKFLAYLAKKGMLTNAGFNSPRTLKEFFTGKQKIDNKVSNNIEIKPTITVESKIYYKKMSLFDAPKNSIICHACNAQGVWGSGIAKEFKSLFPKAFEEYNQYCTMNLPFHLVGTALITKPENSYRVGCLITSSDFGARLGAEQMILTNTKNALDKLGQNCNEPIFYSNKFNSGLFKVPWEKTEKLINDFVKKYNKVWIICDPDLPNE